MPSVQWCPVPPLPAVFTEFDELVTLRGYSIKDWVQGTSVSSLMHGDDEEPGTGASASLCSLSLSTYMCRQIDTWTHTNHKERHDQTRVHEGPEDVRPCLWSKCRLLGLLSTQRTHARKHKKRTVARSSPCSLVGPRARLDICRGHASSFLVYAAHLFSRLFLILFLSDLYVCLCMCILTYISVPLFSEHHT